MLHDSAFAEMETGATALAFASDELIAANGLPQPPRDGTTSPFGPEIALVIGEVAASSRRAVEAGATHVVEPASRPWGQVVGYVPDIDGVPVELCLPIGSG